MGVRVVSVCVQEAELQRLSKAREQELTYKEQMDRLEVDKQKCLAQIESERFSQLVKSLGSDTLQEMARAGPEMQVYELMGVSSSLNFEQKYEGTTCESKCRL